MRTELIKSTYLDFYKKKQPITLTKHFNSLKEMPFNDETFGYSASLASVFSSMIEGNIIDFDIFGAGIKIYTGASPDIVNDEMNKFFNDIDILLKREMSITEIFYFASMIHLILAKIHPFADGNGRSARLLEKWFLAQKLGVKAWFIQSERLYQTRIKSYYKNIDIGTDYTTNNYELSIPFLLMLPMALTMKK